MTRLLSLILFLATAVVARAQTVGERLPAWQPGFLDIHQINTGRGNSALLVFPDGTSMLIDAGDGGWGVGDPNHTDPRPDVSRSAGEVIARYARRVLAHDAEPAINYGYVTHLHSDHIGAVLDSSPASELGAYRRAGFSEVAEHLPIGKIIDRGWPRYDYPAPIDDPSARNYVAFVKARVAAGKMRAEQLRPGRRDQIVLLRNPEKYPEFEVRNIAANGEVWTGVGDATRQHFPAQYRDLPRQDWPTENQCSQAIRISYGRFDYYSGGDMPGNPPAGTPPWQDVETPVAKAVGPVEVAVANHHGNRDSTNAFFVSALRPRLWILPVWSSDHPGHDVLARMLSKRLYPDDRDVLATNMMKVNRSVIGPMLDRLLSSQGHILIRVEPGGGSYRAIVIEDSDESMRVKAVNGPFQAR